MKKVFVIVLSLVLLTVSVSVSTASYIYDDDFVLTPSRILIQYNGPGGDVVVPDGVIAIDNRVFSENNDVTSVTVPDSVIAIAAFAFDQCKYLKTLILPSTITNVPQLMLRGCHNLNSLFIPNSETVISYLAFGYTSSNLTANYPNLTIHSPRGSRTHDFALRYGFGWQEWGEPVMSSLSATLISELEDVESYSLIQPMCDTCHNLGWARLIPGQLEIAQRPYRTIYVAGEVLDRYGLEIDFIEPHWSDYTGPQKKHRLNPSKYSLNLENRPLNAFDRIVNVNYDDFFNDDWDWDGWGRYDNYASYSIRVLTPTVGDLNNDRKIDTNDALILIDKANFNIPLTNADNPLSDLNNDGFVDIDDLTLMLDSNNFNRAVRAPE